MHKHKQESWRSHTSMCTDPFNTFTHTRHHMVYWRVAAKCIISQLLVVQEKWTEECSPSEDALFKVWSVTKAVLTWPQLVTDAISLFKTPVALPQCLHSSLQPPKTTIHPACRAIGFAKPPNWPKTFLNVQAKESLWAAFHLCMMVQLIYYFYKINQSVRQIHLIKWMNTHYSISGSEISSIYNDKKE